MLEDVYIGGREVVFLSNPNTSQSGLFCWSYFTSYNIFEQLIF
jgi:hypothetical protein